MSGAPATLRQIPVAARAALEGLRRRIGWQAERASIGEARLFLSLSVIIGLFTDCSLFCSGSPLTGRISAFLVLLSRHPGCASC